MLQEWQFNVLFFVGVGGAVLLLLGPSVGLEVGNSPTAVTGVGAILTYVLTQRKHLTKSVDKKTEEDGIRRQNESGFSRNPTVLNAVLLCVVAITVFAAFATQKVNNNVQETQENQLRISFCNRRYLQQTIVALNQRTSYVQAQAHINIELQTDQHHFFKVIFQNPRNDKLEMRAFKDYLDSLETFVKINKQISTVNFDPYPTARELQACLNSN